MKGELFNFEDLKNLNSNTKVWGEFKYHGADVYVIKNLHYGITFMKYISESTWISFFMNYSTLKINIENNVVKIYEWLSAKEYIDCRIGIVRNEIDIMLNMNNEEGFMKLTSEYKKLLEEKEFIGE
ncbi:IDEAL domain-containing protein [Clostridium sp. LBM24168]